MNSSALWEIVDFEPNFSEHPGRCGFSIRVSPEFVIASRSRIKKILEKESLASFNQRYNKYLAKALKSRGMGQMIFSERSIVKFDAKIGLRFVKISGNACELYWNTNLDYVEGWGGRYETHNVDSSLQFLMLFFIFRTWARHVVDEAEYQ